MQIIRTSEEAAAAKPAAGLMFQCGDCHQIKPVQTDGGTGYATGPTDKPHALICYACCATRDCAEMRERGIATLYFTIANDGRKEITNWPGTLRFQVTYAAKFRHPFSKCGAWRGEFTGPDGKLWRFRNIGDNQIAHCRRAACR